MVKLDTIIRMDLDLKENDIDSVLKEESCMYGEAIRKRVVEIVTEHVEEILGMRCFGHSWKKHRFTGGWYSC